MSASYLLSVLCLLGAFTATGLAQGTETAVTLWQFGAPRLLPGAGIQPLQILGPPGDGPATTYLYQAVNLDTFTTTDASGFLIQTNAASPTPRTIVASASGWLEIFDVLTLSCGFVDSTYGQCLEIGPSGTTVGNSGAPSPEILFIYPTPVTTSLSAFSSSVSFTSALPTSPTDDQTSNQAAKKAPVAAIAVSASLVLLLGPIIVLWWFRRRRLRNIAKDFYPRPYGAEAAVHTHTPQSQLDVCASEKKVPPDSPRTPPGGEVPSSVPMVSGIPADISTSELAYAYYHRTQAENVDGLPPPEYS